MSEQLLLLNPRRRRRRRVKARRRAAPRRRAAARFFGRTRRRRLENPRRHRRVRARRRVYLSNPRRMLRRRYRHLSNPRNVSMRNVMRDYVIPAGIGGVGAVGLKVGWGYLSPHLPTSFQSGWGALGAQSAVVLAAGFGLGKALPRHRRSIALGVVGALTVIGYTAMVQLLSTYAPKLQGLRDYTDYGLGAYMPGAPAPAALPAPASSRIGLISPAPALRGFSGMGAYMTYGNGGGM